MEIEEPLKCKECGASVDNITAAKNEGLCHDCFSKKVEKIVHPF